ncbi:head-tail connector protein [Actinokineospora spheciospongiae]|uniref:phage gp6-like head-tail connector protein n=1 Tax=Actinokineospora spheciospongiae TaxID=909613 RepID=UPI000D719B3F|nr:phage gp6-like head-tail connector protein [Actinokineospora spheciospongiae]PWW50262.1 hypothetical protein DFQ13_12324 [Actinokineospora spheciospongiae]
MAEWVTLAELKNELKLDGADAGERPGDDERLTRALAAARTFVERIHRGRYNFADVEVSLLPAPTADIKLGTMMLARRLNHRRNSPDGLVSMGELGSARVASFDPDIDRLLRLGRHARPVVG